MRWVSLLGIMLVGCSAPSRMPAGGGIVSTNPCADVMLAELAPERLVAISRYSKDPTASSLPADVAQRFPSTAGTAEEIIALRPALVVTSSFTPIATRDAYARAGLNTLLLDVPETIAASQAQVTALAAAVGQPARGRAMNARIDRALAQAIPLSAARPTALLFIYGALATGPGNLLDDLLQHAGFRNAATGFGLSHTGRVSLETVAARPPAIILTPGPSRGGAIRDRVLARMGAHTRNAMYPANLINCGGPVIAPAIARLAQIRRSLP